MRHFAPKTNKLRPTDSLRASAPSQDSFESQCKLVCLLLRESVLREKNYGVLCFLCNFVRFNQQLDNDDKICYYKDESLLSICGDVQIIGATK